MRRVDFKIPIYDWDLTVVTLYDATDSAQFDEVLKEIYADESQREESLASLRKGSKNGGDLWRDSSVRRALLVIFPWTSEANFVKVLNHEKRHLVDRIMEYAGIKDIEAPAYLDGYISTEIYKHIKELIS